MTVSDEAWRVSIEGRAGVRGRAVLGTGRPHPGDRRAASAWSPDSRWLVLGTSSGAPDQNLVDVTTGAVRDLPQDQFGPIIGILPSGDLVRNATLGTATPGSVDLRLVDPMSGAEQKRISVDASRLLQPGEAVTEQPYLRPSTTEIAFLARSGGYGATRLLVVEVATARAVATIELDHGYRWTLLADLGTRMVLHQQGALTKDRIVLLDPTTGRADVATTMPSGALIRVRGSTLAVL